jgi:hypothetical protein
MTDMSTCGNLASCQATGNSKAEVYITSHLTGPYLARSAKIKGLSEQENPSPDHGLILVRKASKMDCGIASALGYCQKICQ